MRRRAARSRRIESCEGTTQFQLRKGVKRGLHDPETTGGGSWGQVPGGFVHTLSEASEEVNKTEGLQALVPRYCIFGYRILVPTVHWLCPKAPAPLLRAGKLLFGDDGPQGSLKVGDPAFLAIKPQM
jgi:hypothetical protein